MDIELVTIGTELLLGITLDTNAAEIARALAASGVRVTRRASVADRPGWSGSPSNRAVVTDTSSGSVIGEAAGLRRSAICR